MFNKFRLRRRFRQIGSSVDVSFILYVNNQEPISFSSHEDCISYLSNFRKENEIFKLQIFRIETFSL